MFLGKLHRQRMWLSMSAEVRRTNIAWSKICFKVTNFKGHRHWRTHLFILSRLREKETERLRRRQFLRIKRAPFTLHPPCFARMTLPSAALHDDVICGIFIDTEWNSAIHLQILWKLMFYRCSFVALDLEQSRNESEPPVLLCLSQQPCWVFKSSLNPTVLGWQQLTRLHVYAWKTRKTTKTYAS